MIDLIPTPERQEEFWRNVEPITESGCWIWTAGVFGKKGYGAFKVSGQSRRTHRISWTLLRGGIPKGLDVLHKCDVRCCVNPNHLFLGTQMDNMQDMISKGRKVASPGTRNGQVKLTEQQVQEIIADTSMSQSKLAVKYGVCQQSISLIKRRKNWASMGVGE